MTDAIKPRYYGVYNIHTRGTHEMKFSLKPHAKALRDELNGGLCTDPDVDKHWNKDKGWRVCNGPDHWRTES